ncbi:hypothetical protein HD600_001732 [Microbacterium ginsengiterrae]|uniref:Uncharacterized protein n=1 Tax=Microbacterium ginsengiterrae TaxID=546115 RepID=A0A7W9CCU7_9MICO|nr:hypothetical protein [Microbacterium ginsengiterrae]MBB5743235.1 hypothetical protein [Microbacterium ginsengiterrae]
MRATLTADDDAAMSRSVRLRPIAIMALGTIVLPLAIVAMFNSYGPLTEEGAIRMAFASVAGQVVAILSGIVAVGIAVQRRYSIPRIAILGTLTLVIVAVAVGVCTSAGDLLLSRLDLIAETDLLNQ